MLRRLPAVLLFVPLTRTPEAQPRAVDDHAHCFAAREPSGQLLAALRDTHLEHREPVAQLARTGHRNVQPPGRPVVFHIPGDLPHAPAEQPVERIDQLDVRGGVGRLAPRHAGRTDFRVNKLRLQIAIGNIEADHAALSQTLVVRARIRHPVPGLLALARFTLFQPGFVWHDLDWLYDGVLLHNPPKLRNPPHPNKAPITHWHPSHEKMNGMLCCRP